MPVKPVGHTQRYLLDDTESSVQLPELRQGLEKSQGFVEVSQYTPILSASLQVLAGTKYDTGGFSTTKAT